MEELSEYCNISLFSYESNSFVIINIVFKYILKPGQAEESFFGQSSFSKIQFKRTADEL
jgi:hypothetical protein